MRRSLPIILALVLGVLLGGPSRAAEPFPVTVTDLMDRKVTIPSEPKRVILGTGRTIYALDMLFENDLFENIIAWRRDLIRNDDDTYQVYLKRFPSIANLPDVGLVNRGEFDVEYAINIRGDLLILDLDHYPLAHQSGLIETLSATGMETIFIDFKNDPLKNTQRSMALLGAVFNRPGPAAEYNAFYDKHLETLRRADATVRQRRTVFIERAAGINGLDQCCRTWGKSNLGLIAEAAGLENIGSKLLPGAGGTISMEKVLIENPNLYVFSAANWGRHRPDARNIPLGYTIEEEEAQRAFPPLLSRPGFSVLDATHNNQIYALFHQFYNAPFNIIAALYLAKWAYPEMYRDLDPAKEFAFLHDRFLTADFSGTFGLHYHPRETE
ncbi:hypothetical protein [Nisaea sp.]|uniref:hypothetical protein n=1 Tax=Nisaea sp. TaxID=2024842 RepID=UPI0032646A5F